ncbi:thiamine diphosphokinase [uncultured Litoreibacter sp.]|uniref:thiamine diphosphokinase n=1 Tax=uncultured Litoreibacter sp. TaxID=1392394 RepID=UPI00262B4835|nr:thiamine diphosphokinase [uncultured Litoreibacter sp.]
MSEIIVQTHTFLTLLGGGSTHFSHVKQALKIAPILVAADGGADTALAAGHMPDAVIGDMDSISDAARAQIDENHLHYIAEQDSTDFDKCLRSIEAPAILALGFSGGRLDHQLAACTSLVKFPDKRVVMLSEEDLCFLSPQELALDLPTGTRFSLYPMAELRGAGTGLRYPIDGQTMSPSTFVGTSNEVTGPVRLRFESRAMLVILPRDCLDVVLAAIT